MTSIYSSMFPPAPTFTEKSVGNLQGKVCLVTGSTSGIGFELAKILYSKGATVYVGGRSESKISTAIKNIQEATTGKNGELKGFCLDLGDLAAVKPAATRFLSEESRLDILVHNAGVMMPPPGSKTKLGHDLEMGTNCLGPYLLTQLLEDILVKTAASEPKYSVRVLFVTSLVHLADTKEGIEFDDQGTPKVLKKSFDNYVQSKFGGQFLAKDVASRLDKSGIMSVGVHPGLLKTDLQRNDSPVPQIFFKLFFNKPAIFGAYTELFAAFSSEVKAEHNGGYIIAWGRTAPMPAIVEKGLKSQKEGGNSAAKKFMDYCVRETAPIPVNGDHDAWS